MGLLDGGKWQVLVTTGAAIWGAANCSKLLRRAAVSGCGCPSGCL